MKMISAAALCVSLCLAIGLAACSNDSWRDATNQRRGDAEFQMDYAICQQAGDIAQSDALSEASGTCAGEKCSALQALASPIARSPAIDNCLMARGWRKVAALPSPSGSKPDAAAQGLLQPVPDATRVFVFPVYSSFADRAWFGTTYKLTIGGRPVAAFSDSQFLEIEMKPGVYLLTVQELGWKGDLLSQASANLNVGVPGNIMFVALPTSSTNVSLELVSADYGVEKVSNRKKAASIKFQSD